MTQQINLYDPRLRRQRELLTVTSLALASVVLLLIVVGAGAWARAAAVKLEAEAALLAPQAKALQDQLPVLGQQLSALKADARLDQELVELKERETSHAVILALLQKGMGPEAVSFAEYLRGFARQTPSGLWLTGFSVAGDGTGMVIQGRTTDPALVPKYINRLNGEKAFQGRAFAALQLNVPGSAVGSSVPSAANGLQLRPAYLEFALTPIQETGAESASENAGRKSGGDH
ncbi:MAG: PilN domain-containing protein [Georgfuchsia sp.]